MMLSVRLAPHEMLALERYCRERRMTKTAVVVELLREHVLRGPEKTPLELAEEVGFLDSGDDLAPPDLSQRTSEQVKKRLRDKHSPRHRRARRTSSAA